MSKRVLSDPSFESQNLHLDYFDCQEKSEVIDEIYSDPLNAEDPFYFLDLGQLKRNALLFKENFLPDDPNSVVAYAVKANPMPIILQTFVEQGIDCFDCASLGEISEVRKFLDHNNQILFNHPIKKAKDIKTAYSKYHVSHFTAQTSDEVDKIIRNIGAFDLANPVEIAVRMRTENPEADINLSEKYGAPVEIIKSLLDKIKRIGAAAGISIHTGSQNKDPKTYEIAIEQVENVTQGMNGLVSLNVGGGIPVNYFNDLGLNTVDYLEAISRAVRGLKLRNPRLLNDEHKVIIEIGRALVASAVDLVVPVLAREERDGMNTLYLSDGVFGSFSDFAVHGWPYNFEKFGSGEGRNGKENYRLFGPTCDSGDQMGIVSLPVGIQAGDRLHLKNAGAYMHSQRSNFNYIEQPKVIIYNQL